MTSALTHLLLAVGTLALAIAPAASAQAPAAQAALAQSSYQLIDTTPLDSLSPGADSRWRIEAATGLGERHQLRLSTHAIGYASPLGNYGHTSYLDSRATWRYTVYEHSNWAWRLGLTSSLGQRDARSASLERTRFGSLPLLHVAGEGSIARKWLLGFDADTLMTARGYSIDLGLRVSYQLAPNFSLVGGYRLSDTSVDGEEFYSPGFTNSANVGLRLRF
jgi:opacity protein-like surface antigen